MAYIGKGLDNLGDVQTLDNITFNNGAGPYNLQQGGVQVTNADTDSIMISIDGVVQGGNYTVSSSAGQITFDFSVPSNSVCNFVKLFGTGVQLTPKSNSVSADKLSTTGISAGQVFKVNDAGNAWELGNASSAEIYGFTMIDTNSDNILDSLQVTTTNGGQDNITAAVYAAFDDKIFAASGFTFSLNSDGHLIATIWCTLNVYE